MWGSRQKTKTQYENACKDLQEGTFERAIETFTACIISQPQEAAAYCGRAIAHFELKHWKAAQADFRRARDLNPDDPESWIGLGMSLAMELQIFPAIEVVETYLMSHPTYMRAHLVLGMLYFRLGVLHKGRNYLEKARELDPSPEDLRLIESQLQEQAQIYQKRSYCSDLGALHQPDRTSDE